MLLLSCDVEILVWDSCSVVSSPSCERVHRQTVTTSHHTSVSCFVHVSVRLDGHGAITSSSGASPHTEAPRPPSLPCQRYDAAPSVHHTLRRTLRHYILVALGCAITSRQTAWVSMATVLTKRKKTFECERGIFGICKTYLH